MRRLTAFATLLMVLMIPAERASATMVAGCGEWSSAGAYRDHR